MLFGAHVSAAGGISKAIDRIDEVGGNAVQVFTQSPRMWRPTAHTAEEVERFRARRREARVRHVACHALYLVNLASRDPEVRVKSFDALARDDGDGTGDRCRHGRLPRRLAPRLRLRRRGARGGSRASRAPLAHDGGPLAVPRERRWRRRDDRPLGRRARRDLRRARRARAAGHLPRLVSLVGVRCRRDEPGRRWTRRSTISTHGSGSIASACCT